MDLDLIFDDTEEKKPLSAKVPGDDEDWAQFLNELDSQLGNTPAPQPKKRKPAAPPPAPVQERKQEPRRKKRGLLVPILICLLVLILAGGSVFLFWQPVEKAPANAALGSISLGNLTRAQAEKRLQEALVDPLAANGMTISFPTSQVQIFAQYVSAQWNVEGILDAAFLSDAPLSPADFFQVDEAAIRGVLTRYLDSTGSDYQPSGYALQGELPALSAVNPETECPTLVLTRGSSGSYGDVDAAAAQILDAFYHGSSQVDLTGWITEMQPEPLNLDAIAEDVCSEPFVILSDGQATVRYGIGFGMDEAQALLAEGRETVEIPLHWIEPNYLAADPEFTDVLGFAQTPHSDNDKRNVNLRLACAALNGIVLQPGDSISYNATLGERTAENGYQPAPAYSGTDLVDSLGGGICQVSSTLYLSSLFAELEVVNRVNHGFPANYMPIGLDATVSWGSPDLVLRNSYDHPIKIVAEAVDGYVRVWLLGKETRDYEVRVLFSSGGTYAKSVIRHYDPQSGELLSEDEPRFSGYLDEVTSVRGELTTGDTYRWGNVIPNDLSMPTQDTLIQSLVHQEANTRGN